MHKRRHTGGKRHSSTKKRKFLLARPAANTKLGERRIRDVRTRGGNHKTRALRLDVGNFSWGSEVCTRKARILDVVYNASNNELVRTKTLVKGCIVSIDAHPFQKWYQSHYGVEIAKGKAEPEKASSAVLAKHKKRCQDRTLDAGLEEQIASSRILARLSSRPGQSGRADGYILEGKELEFYKRALSKKK